jgi:hypothetical protein
MKMRWEGGPLDGCSEDLTRPPSVWIGPDVTEPKEKVVVYLFFSAGKFVFSKEATEFANARIQALKN